MSARRPGLFETRLLSRALAKALYPSSGVTMGSWNATHWLSTPVIGCQTGRAGRSVGHDEHVAPSHQQCRLEQPTTSTSKINSVWLSLREPCRPRAEQEWYFISFPDIPKPLDDRSKLAYVFLRRSRNSAFRPG